MEHRKYDDAAIFEEVKNEIGKAMHDGTAHLVVDELKCFWLFSYLLETRDGGGQELFAEFVAALGLIPPARRSQISSDTRAK